MDFVGHAVIGGMMMHRAARALTPRRGLLLAGAIYGAVMGAWADVVPWLMATFFGADRWGGLYDFYHHTLSWWDANPPFAVHVLMDLPWHRADGGWTPFGWVAEFVVWGALLMYGYNQWKEGAWKDS